MERRFCCAKSVACGRVIEREWGNPSKVPPSHSPFLAVGGSAGNKTCGQSQKETPSDRMGYSFWNAAGRLELAASTSAKRVKSRGKGRAPANGSAIRGMPGSEFEPRLFCCAKSVACGRVMNASGGTRQRFPPHTPPSLRCAGVRQQNLWAVTKRNTIRIGWCFFLECRGQGGTRCLDQREARQTVP